jgi:hypothetical protein
VETVEEPAAPAETPEVELPSTPDTEEPEVITTPAEAKEEPAPPAEITPVVPEVSAPATEKAPKRITDWIIFVCIAFAGAVIIGLAYRRKRSNQKTS